MKLSNVILITAGGAGSGCKGSNCGRRRSNVDELYKQHDLIKESVYEHPSEEYLHQKRQLGQLLEGAKSINEKDPSLTKATELLATADGHAKYLKYSLATIYQELALQHIHQFLERTRSSKRQRISARSSK